MTKVPATFSGFIRDLTAGLVSGAALGVGMAASVLTANLLTACTIAPTKTGETQHREFEKVIDKSLGPLEITEQTVVLDTRESFAYGLNRVQDAIHFPWTSLVESEKTGEILKDLRQATLRLSLAGVGPDTPVVVVGEGSRGQGEDGRLAWTLLYLGVKDVQLAAMEPLRKNWTQAPSPPAKNLGMWSARPNSDLVITKSEFQALAQDPQGRLKKRIWILDVRSEKEYFNKAASAGSAKPAPDIGAVSVPWREFFSANSGRPNPSIVRKLEALGIHPNDRVILLSQRGVRSGAASYALIALGYQHVQNFTDGWRSLL